MKSKRRCQVCGEAIKDPRRTTYCSAECSWVMSNHNIAAYWADNPVLLWTRRIVGSEIALDETLIWDHPTRIILHRAHHFIYWVWVDGKPYKAQGRQALSQARDFVLQELGIENAA